MYLVKIYFHFPLPTFIVGETRKLDPRAKKGVTGTRFLGGSAGTSKNSNHPLVSLHVCFQSSWIRVLVTCSITKVLKSCAVCSCSKQQSEDIMRNLPFSVHKVDIELPTVLCSCSRDHKKAVKHNCGSVSGLEIKAQP